MPDRQQRQRASQKNQKRQQRQQKVERQRGRGGESVVRQKAADRGGRDTATYCLEAAPSTSVPSCLAEPLVAMR